MLKKLIVITVLLFTVFISFPASAVDNTSEIPEMNPFCWHRKDCHTIRKTFLANPPSCTVGDPSCKELEQGFITAGVDPCTGGTGADQWGRCLPAGTTKTEISFGGKSEFSNIGEFIILMYKYLLTIASIVAVVMIIIAGAQWITSGGNSEAIGSAKKRIGGALIGLFIAYMSYFVLNTINPALVNLRLPQVWLIRSLALMPEFCSDLPGATTTLKFAVIPNVTYPPPSLPPSDKRVYEVISSLGHLCGNRYLAENGGESTCMGNKCATGGGLFGCIDTKGDRTGYECKENVRIFGIISYSALARCGILKSIVNAATDIFGPWCSPPINNSAIVAVCGSQNGFFPIGKGYGEQNNKYWIEADNESIENNFCGKNLKGFAVIFSMDRDYGDDPTRVVGKGGVEIGGPYMVISNAFHVDETNYQYLFTKDELLKGNMRMDVDAARIKL